MTVTTPFASRLSIADRPGIPQTQLPRALRALLTALPIMITAFAAPVQAQPKEVRASEFKLANGMQVVVIPDRRAPVVTHMVWYRTGAADEPRGVSGIAHFLEHLMFKSTEKVPSGQFSKIVSRLGGNHNAFTSQDATAYYQSIAKDRLARVMELEADRMVNLRLDEKEVLTERDVILEERRSRVENNPSAILGEQMSASLYLSHPYGIPIIGWEHEIAKLSREDALVHYRRYYAPNNAILIVAGDVAADEVKALAEKTYGTIPFNPTVTPRVRVKEPPHVSPRRVELRDARAGKPVLRRSYLMPSYVTAKTGEAEALDLLFKVIAGGTTSRLYQKLVVEQKLASQASGWYDGSAMDSGVAGVSAVPADGVSLQTLEEAIDAVISEVREKGVTAAELERARNLYLADYIYESDNQSTMARRYGWALVVGATVKDVEEGPDRIAKVTLDEVNRAANEHIDIRRSVTGTLLPIGAEQNSGGATAVPPAAPAAAKPVAPSRS